MFDYILKRLFFEGSRDKYKLFIAAPLTFREDERYKDIIDHAIEAFEKYNCVHVEDYFNTFILRERKPELNKFFKKIEDALEKRKNNNKIARFARDFYEKEWWIRTCYTVVKNSNSILYILPKPIVSGETLTQGALFESQVALEDKKPVTVFSYTRGKNGDLIEESEIFQITSLDEIFERYSNGQKLVAPEKWFKREPMDIDIKWRENGMKPSQK